MNDQVLKAAKPVDCIGISVLLTLHGTYGAAEPGRVRKSAGSAGQRAVEDATEPLRAMHGWMEEVICDRTACEPSVLPIWASRHTAA